MEHSFTGIEEAEKRTAAEELLYGKKPIRLQTGTATDNSGEEIKELFEELGDKWGMSFKIQ